MARGKHGHKKGLIPKTMGGIIGFALKLTGGVVILSPAISAVTQSLNDPANIPNWVVYNYSGYSPGTKTFNSEQLAVGVATVASGVGLIYLGKFLGKHLR